MTDLLRPYQAAATDRVREHIRAGVRAPLLVAPTGAGKTVIASAIMRSAHSRGKRVMFFAHRRELINQTVVKLIAAGIADDAIGVLMGADKRRRPEALIQVASIDTWRNRERLPADLVIIDEAHRSLSATYREAIKHYVETGAVVLGLTATPYRADGGGLGDVYEVLEPVATVRELIALGYLAEPRVFSATALPDLSRVHTRHGDFIESELAGVMNTGALVGNVVEHYQEHGNGHRAVLFAVTVEHSKACAAAFNAAGIVAEHLDGETPTAERDAILARLESGETRVVCNCGVLCEGWDMPSVKVCILARPTKSTGLYLQQAGRILRPWCDVRPVVLDHAGNALRHGLPQEDRTFTLAGIEAEQRKRAEAQARCCPACRAVLELKSTRCDACGAEVPRVERDQPVVSAPGRLVELTQAERARLAGEHRRSFDRLVEQWHISNARREKHGMRLLKPGLIYHQFRERFGCKPPAGCKLPPEAATVAERAEALRALKAEADRRGFKRGWAVHRYQARFGQPPSAVEVAS